MGQTLVEILEAAARGKNLPWMSLQAAHVQIRRLGRTLGLNQPTRGTEN